MDRSWMQLKDRWCQTYIDGVRDFMRTASNYAYSGETFQLHAAVLWTINDFPAYGMLSGWSTKGKLACPICNKDTCSLTLKNGQKQCYMGHRRYLDPNHVWRRSKKFDGKQEHRPEPKILTEDEIREKILKTKTGYSRGLGYGVKPPKGTSLGASARIQAQRVEEADKRAEEADKRAKEADKRAEKAEQRAQQFQEEIQDLRSTITKLQESQQDLQQAFQTFMAQFDGRIP